MSLPLCLRLCIVPVLSAGELESGSEDEAEDAAAAKGRKPALPAAGGGKEAIKPVEVSDDEDEEEEEEDE